MKADMGSMRFALGLLLLAAGCALMQPSPGGKTPSSTLTSEMLDSKLRKGMIEEHVEIAIGKPSEVFERKRTKLLAYRVTDQSGYPAMYLVALRSFFVIGWGSLDEMQRYFAQEFLDHTPLELCNEGNEWKRYGSMAECKEDKIREREAVRGDLVREHADFERRRQIAIEFLLRQQGAAAPVPAFQYQPMYQQPVQLPTPAPIRQPMNCTTRPVLGTLQTTCQ